MSGIGDISVPGELKQVIAVHLDELAKSLDRYFPTRESYPAWVRQPFTFSVATADVNSLTKSLNFSRASFNNNSSEQQRSQRFGVTKSYHTLLLLRKPLRYSHHLYLCEQSFSRMVDIKTKKRNRICCENDMRGALAKVKPRISGTVKVTFICSKYSLSYVFVWNSCLVGFVL